MIILAVGTAQFIYTLYANILDQWDLSSSLGIQVILGNAAARCPACKPEPRNQNLQFVNH